MGLFHQMADRLRYGRDGHPDPAAEFAAARWRQKAMLADVQRDLDELADERAYVDVKRARSRETGARLESDAAAAAADGCAGIAAELREERRRAYAVLDELAEVRQAVSTEEARLLRLAKRLADQLAEGDALAGAMRAEPADGVRARVHRLAGETARTAADEQDRLETEF